MKLVADTHCHTIASGHAYSTVQEMAQQAAEKGLSLIAMTDHGPAMPYAASKLHFRNLKVLPSHMYGVEILKGAEVNIIGLDGKLDLSDSILQQLELVIASFHLPCIKPGSEKENTNALIEVMKNPHVHILGHTGNPAFPIHVERMVEAAGKYGKLIEINNSSLTPHSFRQGSWERCLKILETCRNYKVPVVVGSDAHISWDVGRFDKANEMIRQLNVPDSLVFCNDPKALKARLSVEEKRNRKTP
ncbi:MAG: phosphatase [Tindallia sp. MSAO_Bac2]|nr:MAG: phosphatase [Tindallia sp. MSAO_Bac2]